MSKNIVFEGWLTKSPPAKRIWRAKWRRRWFCLRQSGELPGQYFLDYYADQNCRRLKGTINLDLCEQVDAGLHMNRGPLDSKLRGSVFTVRTQSRTYHLEADCQTDMEKWVDAICSVCGLRATDEADVIETYQSNVLAMTATNDQYHCTDNGTYIPISECRTGAPVQDGQRTFTFDAKDLMSNRRSLERVSNNKAHLMYTSQPHIRVNADFSENESNMSDEDSKSLNASESNIEDWHVERSFKKLGLNTKKNGYSEEGPPVPPRPPKTLTRDVYTKEAFHGPILQEPIEHCVDSCMSDQISPLWRNSRRSSGIQPSPSKYQHRYIDDDDDHQHLGHPSLQYFNLTSLPPAVDRALKPRHSSFGHINHLFAHQGLVPHGYREDDAKANILQYLDLDLHNSKPSMSKPQIETKRKLEVNHGKSLSAMESDSAYKTVDFLKTEAFNSTRQDAEASRNTHH